MLVTHCKQTTAPISYFPFDKTPALHHGCAIRVARWTLALVLMLTVSSPFAAHADQSLTLELPPSKEAQEAHAEERARLNALTAHTRVNPGANPGRGGQMVRSQGRYHPGRDTQPSRHQNGAERVVGKLGEVQSAAPIRRTRSSHAPQLTLASAGTYIAVEDEQGEWYGVLMADGSMGWINRAAVRMLDYQVVSNGQLPTTPPGWNTEGGSAPSGIGGPDIYPRSDRPYFTANPQAFMNEAYKYLGVPYVWGGNTYNGIDCSGFVKNVYDSLGFPLPRLGSDQMAYGIPVPVEELQPGDRLYFTPRTERVGVHHTGLYVGNGYFIHASSGSHRVRVSHLSESYYRKNFVCARR